MNQEKIGQLIKDLRLKSNLTQKEFAEKYNVTYQAVSKWENGKNLPDMLILKKIADDYNINLDDILDGNYNKKVINKKLIFTVLGLLLFLLFAFIIFINIDKENHNFEFKVISTSCENFKINGSLAYNKKQATIYISNIEYCGDNENEIYKQIECNLYEQIDNTSKLLAKCNYQNNQNLTLKNYLKNVSINLNNFQNTCNNYTNLALKITAINQNNQQIIFDIPLTINNC